jgi:hypothetical protein
LELGIDAALLHLNLASDPKVGGQRGQDAALDFLLLGRAAHEAQAEFKDWVVGPPQGFLAPSSLEMT